MTATTDNMTATTDNGDAPDRSTSRRRTLIAFSVFVLVVVCLMAWTRYGSPIIPVPKLYKPGYGAEYATKLARPAQWLSFVLLVAGWILVFIGSILQMTAAVVGQAAKGGENENIFGVLRRQRGLLCSAFAIVSLGAGWQCLDRSSAASQVAKIATRAMLHLSADAPSDPSDKNAYEACVRAKVLWLEGRMNHDRIQSILNELAKTPEDEPPPQRKDQG